MTLPPRPPTPGSQPASVDPAVSPPGPQADDNMPQTGKQRGKQKKSKEQKKEQPKQEEMQSGQGNNPDEKKKKKRGGPKFVPAAIMLICLGALGLFYMGIREVRVGPPGSRQQSGLGFSVKLPNGWVRTKQGDVDNSSYRYAYGPQGNKQQLMFVTLYKTKNKLNVTDKAVRNEAVSVLKSSGARNIHTTISHIDEKDAFRATYQASSLTITGWLVANGRKQWQFSCQRRSSVFLKECQTFLKNLRWNRK